MENWRGQALQAMAWREAPTIASLLRAPVKEGALGFAIWMLGEVQLRHRPYTRDAVFRTVL